MDTFSSSGNGLSRWGGWPAKIRTIQRKRINVTANIMQSWWPFKNYHKEKMILRLFGWSELKNSIAQIEHHKLSAFANCQAAIFFRNNEMHVSYRDRKFDATEGNFTSPNLNTQCKHPAYLDGISTNFCFIQTSCRRANRLPVSAAEKLGTFTWAAEIFVLK